MSETVVLERPEEHQFDMVLQQPVQFDVAPHLTEEVAAAALEAEKLRPNYLKPEERRELISEQDRQDFETLTLHELQKEVDEDSYREWQDANERLRNSDNIYTQMLVFCEDLEMAVYTRQEGDHSINRDHPLLRLIVEETDLPPLVAKELKDVQYHAAYYYLAMRSRDSEEAQTYRLADPELQLDAATKRMLCSMADQLTVKTVGEGRFVTEAVRTVAEEDMPQLLATLDANLRQEPDTTVYVAKILAQVNSGLDHVEREKMNSQRHSKEYSIDVHEAEQKLKTGREWHAYESARTNTTQPEQDAVLRGVSLTDEEFQRIHTHRDLFQKRNMNLEPKQALKYIIDNPKVMQVLEACNEHTAPQVVELLDGIYIQALARCDNEVRELNLDSKQYGIRIERRDAMLDERYRACVADVMAELEKIAGEPDAMMIVKNLHALVPGNESMVFGEFQPETVAIMLKKYPALVRLEAFPEIARDLFSNADIYERTTPSPGAHEVTSEVFAGLLAKVERVAAERPALFEVMAFDQINERVSYIGIADAFDSGLIIVSEEPITDAALEMLINAPDNLSPEELHYFYEALLDGVCPDERRMTELYGGTLSERKLKEIYTLPFDDGNIKVLLQLYMSAKIPPQKFFDLRTLRLDTETVDYIAENPNILEILTRKTNPDELRQVIDRLNISGENIDQIKYLDAVTQSVDFLGEHADEALFEVYYYILRGDISGAQQKGGIRITAEGQAGIDQLKSQLVKFRDEVLSGTVDIDKIESSPVYMAYFKSLVRYASSEWGSHDDGSLMMLYKDVEYARSEDCTGLIDAEAYQPSQEIAIAKVDQAALDAFEITKDSQALWRELTEDIRAANAIVFIDQPQLLEGVISDIDEKVQKHIKRLEGGRLMLEYRLEELTPEQRIQLQSESETVIAEIARLEESGAQNDEAFQEQLERLKLNQRVLKARLAQVPENKQAKLHSSIEAVNVQIAELRDTTQGELLQTSKIIRHLRVLSQYDDMKSPLRKALFTATLMKYPNEQARVARLLGTPSDKVKLTDLERMSEFVQHMTNQETWGPIAAAFELQKGFNRILEIGAIDEDISRGKNIGSSGVRSLQFIPTRDALMELSGHIGDACWANRYDSIARQFPNFTSVIMVQKPGTKDARLAGSAFLVEARDTKGEPVLVIRGLNPIQNVIEQLDEEDFFKNFSNYAREIADQRGMKLAVVIDGHSGGSATNRPKLFRHLSEQLKPQLKQVQLADEPITDFNGYNIQENTYLL